MYRITFTNNKGYTYSYLERDDERDLTAGTWEAPFRNASGNSPAYGLVEGLMQSDNCPPVFYQDQPLVVTIELVPDESS